MTDQLNSNQPLEMDF